MAIDSAKATLAVKRRLACEMVKYWQQAQDNIMNLPLSNGWGEKHRHFIKWKYVEAKGKYREISRKRACEVFNSAHHLSSQINFSLIGPDGTTSQRGNPDPVGSKFP
ncbi:hypothetical protein V6N13_135427 [Hibiscus sabdariffa]